MKPVILFDLDCTLLQMNQDIFLKQYFNLVYMKAKELGYQPDEFLQTFSKAAYTIVKNDGRVTNEELFWKQMKKTYPDVDRLKDVFYDFYLNEFNTISNIVQVQSISNEIIKELKKKGYFIILATNPLFPRICTEQRIRWANMNPDDFDYISTYENSTYCKPNHLYYEEIFEKLNLKMEGSIMVGNDVEDDFSDLPKEIKKILITDFLINTNNLKIDMPTYTLTEFLNFVKEVL